MDNLLRTIHFTSSILKEERIIHLFATDPALWASGARVPFIFLQDGQNLFDGIRNGRQKWGIEENALLLKRQNKLCSDLFFIGVEHGMGRARDYTPTRDPHTRQGGGVKNYLKFLMEELCPHLEKNHNLHPEPGKTTIGGSSLGGICSLYAWFYHPEFFQNFMVMSPSLWWGNWATLELIKTQKLQKQGHRLWIDMGEWEQSTETIEEIRHFLRKEGVPERDVDQHIPFSIQDTRRLVDRLEERGLRNPEDFFYYEDPSGRHDELTWRRRLYDILIYFFFRKDLQKARGL